MPRAEWIIANPCVGSKGSRISSRGGNSRARNSAAVSGRSRGIISAAPSMIRRTTAVPSSGDISYLLDPCMHAAHQHVIEVAAGLGRHRYPHPTTLAEPSIGSSAGRALAGTGDVVIG